jgi:hypothetical protein
MTGKMPRVEFGIRPASALQCLLDLAEWGLVRLVWEVEMKSLVVADERVGLPNPLADVAKRRRRAKT